MNKVVSISGAIHFYTQSTKIPKCLKGHVSKNVERYDEDGPWWHCKKCDEYWPRINDDRHTLQSFTYPSKSAPDIKALLELIVFSVNEETGERYKVVLDREKVIKDLMP